MQQVLHSAMNLLQIATAHVTTVALFLDDKTNDDGEGKENGKK